MKFQGLVNTQNPFNPQISSTQTLSGREPAPQADSMEFSPKDTSTQHLDRGWRAKMGEEMVYGYPSQDYVVGGPHNFMEIKNIFTGSMEKVLIDPPDHHGYVTKQQGDAINSKLLSGTGVRLSLEGNIGSGNLVVARFLLLIMACR